MTQQSLHNSVLTPNYVLRSLIAQWCETNGVEVPKRPGTSNPSKTISACSAAERFKIDELLRKLHSGNPDDQRSCTGEIRLLAKRNADNRVAIAEAGAIPLLVNLLLTLDSAPKSMRLSVVNENKVTIGGSGAVPLLVMLLSEGTQRGKKDAATALFNLCIYQGNKGKAVRAGIVPTLMRLLTELGGGMLDEALAILAILASHPESKAAIGNANALPVLVDIIANGSPRNKENATAVLVHLCSGDPNYLLAAQELGIMNPLLEMIQNGTERGKRKAQQLLDRMN